MSNFHTINVKDMNSMFSNCFSLKTINLSSFNTEKLTDMGGMFSKCLSLKELDLSNFDTKNVENMCCTFFQCSSLKELNLSNFHINKTTYVVDMIHGCPDGLKIKTKEKVRILNLGKSVKK